MISDCDLVYTPMIGQKVSLAFQRKPSGQTKTVMIEMTIWMLLLISFEVDSLAGH